MQGRRGRCRRERCVGRRSGWRHGQKDRAAQGGPEQHQGIHGGKTAQDGRGSSSLSLPLGRVLEPVLLLLLALGEHGAIPQFQRLARDSPLVSYVVKLITT